MQDLDDVEVTKVGDYEAALHGFAKANANKLLDQINESGDFNDEIEAEMKNVCDDFTKKGAY